MNRRYTLTQRIIPLGHPSVVEPYKSVTATAMFSVDNKYTYKTKWFVDLSDQNMTIKDKTQTIQVLKNHRS